MNVTFLQVGGLLFEGEGMYFESFFVPCMMEVLKKPHR